jgi:hypothetical protein
MRLLITSAAGAALILCGLISTLAAAEKAAAGKSLAGEKAAKLVTAALQAEAEGSAGSRAALLKQALAADPNQLRPGQYLHGVNGPVSVAAYETAQPKEVYNLVVSDWHTFFVGQQGLLVHDNSPIEEVSTVVPGLDFRDAAN